MKKYVCRICGYVYDEAREGVAFDSLPGDWKCPLCRAPKSEFAPEQPAQPAPQPAPAAEASADLKQLSAGQLAAVCSNLARGCEKQYLAEESALFTQLAQYFSSVTPAVEDATVVELIRQLQEDADGYAGVRATADAASDRGAARICVWGEKVTRMLLSLVKRYLEEGEQLLAGTEIWVCTACGFVYIGDQPPELCPVCKVPAWKFERIERRAAV